MIQRRLLNSPLPMDILNVDTPNGYTQSTELPSSHGYAAADRAVPSERKPGKQLSASPPLSKREISTLKWVGKAETHSCHKP